MNLPFGSKLKRLVEDAWDQYDYFKSQSRNDRKWHIGGNTPILYFGDIWSYLSSSLKIITVGYNPSEGEFSENRSSFQNLRRSKSSATYLKALNTYFDNNPFEVWFKHYQSVLDGLDATYGGKMEVTGKPRRLPHRVAIHTDLCSPLATRPAWGKLPEKARAALQREGTCTWRSLVKDCLKPDIIMISVAPQYMDDEIIPVSKLKILMRTPRGRHGKPYPVKTGVLRYNGNKAVVVYGELNHFPFLVNKQGKSNIGRRVREKYQSLLSQDPMSTL
jgi:hypothetical protein